mmetsp:Transcript_87548/g.137116  ORF Transcript_87548/g.137116 Transcript_87548/m.137116 type:complete len:336 (+) Transcript_87548:860-1867(+)
MTIIFFVIMRLCAFNCLLRARCTTSIGCLFFIFIYRFCLLLFHVTFQLFSKLLHCLQMFFAPRMLIILRLRLEGLAARLAIKLDSFLLTRLVILTDGFSPRSALVSGCFHLCPTFLFSFSGCLFLLLPLFSFRLLSLLFLCIFFLRSLNSLFHLLLLVLDYSRIASMYSLYYLPHFTIKFLFRYLSRLLVFLLHSSSHLSTLSFSRIPLVCMTKRFSRAEIQPMLIKCCNVGPITIGSAEGGHSYMLLIGIFPIFFLFIYCSEKLCVDSEEAVGPVVEAIVAASAEIFIQIYSGLEWIFTRLIVTFQNLLSMCIVPCSFLWIRQRAICFLYLLKS